jgi:hypothetical protein
MGSRRREEETVSEETRFWGLAIKGYDQEAYGQEVRRESRLLGGWRLTFPNGETVPFHPVFSSRERAQDWVREHRQQLLSPPTAEKLQLAEDLVDSVRPIKADDIPTDHYVWSDRKGLVTWGELLAEVE